MQMQQVGNYKFCEVESKNKSGSYGVVRKVIHIQSGKIYALKQLKFGITEQGYSPSAIRQITILKELSEHRNILKLIEIFMSQGYIYLVFDYYQINLRQYIYHFDINQQSIKKFLYQLLDSVEFAHSRRIMHRDLKPDNILVNKSPKNNSYDVTIADWGLSRLFFNSKQVYTIQVVSLPYRAPEVLLGMKDYTCAIDIWSIGCIFAEMITKQRLFEGTSQASQLLTILNSFQTPTIQQWPFLYKVLNVNSYILKKIPKTYLKNKIVGISELGLDLLQMMLKLNPDKRISAYQAMKHPYFSNS